MRQLYVKMMVLKSQFHYDGHNDAQDSVRYTQKHVWALRIRCRSLALTNGNGKRVCLYMSQNTIPRLTVQLLW